MSSLEIEKSWSYYVPVGVSLLFLCSLLVITLSSWFRNDPFANMPGPRGFPIIGNLLTCRQSFDMFNYGIQSLKKYGDTYKETFMGASTVTTCNPDYVKHVLITNASNYIQPDILKTALYGGPGTSLLFSGGKEHARQRRMLNPCFTMEALTKSIPIVKEKSNNLVQFWKDKIIAAENGVITTAIEGKFAHVTLDIFGDYGFSRKFNTTLYGYTKQTSSLRRILDDQFNFVSRVLELALPFLKWIPFVRNKVNDAFSDFYALTNTLIAERKQNMIDNPDTDIKDLLDVLLRLRDDEGMGFTDDDVTCQIFTFLMAGHETTSMALTWTTYLLAKHPDVQSKVRQELHDVIGDPNKLEAHHLDELKFLECCIKESMRLYPPVTTVMKHAVNDDRLGPYFIPAGTDIFCQIGMIQRNEKYWKDANEFRPERFFNEDSKDATMLFRFFPFSRGVHQCIGYRLAMIQLKIILATVFLSFDLKLSKDNPEQIGTRTLLSLKPCPSPKIDIRLLCD